MLESPLIARLESVPFSRFHAKARIVVGSATFFDAFNALALAFALPVLIRLWNITPAETGFLIGASYVGQLAGALLFSWLAERFGRVPSAAAATALMSIMSLACALAGSFPALFAYRLIQGIGVGGEMPVAAAYISELSKARGRGKFFMLYEMIFPIGLMTTSQAGALVIPLWGWKALFLIGGIPGLFITWLLLRLPESPRWLISKGRIAEAEFVVKQIEASANSGGAPPSAPSDLPAKPPERGQWADVLAPSFRSRTLIVWTLWASAYFVTNSLNNWMPSLYNTVYHLGLQQSLRAASMTNVAQVAVLLVCAFCIDRIGRRKWTVVCFLVGGAGLAALAFTGAQNVANVIILGTLSYGIIGSINAVLYLYTPEIYPTRMRAIGTGLATSWLRLASAVGPAIVGMMVGAEGIGSVFIMFAVISAVGAVAALWMIETQGRRLEEIAG
ncbi:MAG: MFS transporter [Acidobacteria bacterium]|nr:MAG: MFS transporter [Acidobacteriota bacterium]